MDPFGISLGLGALSAGTSWFARQSEAKALRAQTEEQVRRMQARNAQTLGQGTAAGAASGVEFDSGSLQSHLSAMSEEFRRQEDLVRQAGMASADATSLAGSLGLVTDLGGALFKYGSDNNWFRTAQLTPGKKT